MQHIFFHKETTILDSEHGWNLWLSGTLSSNVYASYDLEASRPLTPSLLLDSLSEQRGERGVQTYLHRSYSVHQRERVF